MITLGRFGIWSGQLRFGDAAEAGEAAAELEDLGFDALWIPGGIGGAVFDDCERLLAATEHVVVATGIVNIWMHTPDEAAAGHARLTAGFPGRFLLGLGVSHGPLLERTGRTYERPLQVMREYLDALDAARPPVPEEERVLAALGPRMLELARERTAGAHPYLVTPEHAQQARQRLGDDAILAPEQAVALVTDPAAARELARQHLAIYLGLPNYTDNWRRLGFTDDDLAGGGSDRLVDALVAWGTLDRVVDRVVAHLAAGADHVCIQVLAPDLRSFPRAQWRELAAALRARA